MLFLKEADLEKPKRHAEIEKLLEAASKRPSGILYEHEVYQLLELMGLESPAHHFSAFGNDPAELSGKLPHSGPFVAKAVCEGKTHKTDIDGIAFNIMKANAGEVVEHFSKQFGAHRFLGTLFVEQVEHAHGLSDEMLLGLYQDPFFGPCVCLGFGGTAAEYYKDIMRPQNAQVFIPAAIDLDHADRFLKNLPVVKFSEGGVRGVKEKLERREILRALKIFQNLGRYYSASNPQAPFIIEELEINPAAVQGGRIIALDGVLCARKNTAGKVQAKPLRKIKNLLDPRSLAIAGASGKNAANPANAILGKFLNAGLPRENIHLLHPKEDEIDGIKCVKSVQELVAQRSGEPVDCFIVGVPAKIAGSLVLESMDAFAAHSIEIISAGFGETKNGHEMQEELTAKLNKMNGDIEKRPVINGPNTLGNIYGTVETLFTPRYKSSATGKGKTNAALICQSGAFMITRISDLADAVAPKIAVSTGNQMDLSVTDFLEYLMNEKGVDTFGLYIEGLNRGDGLRLMELISAAGRTGRRVVIYKAGRTEAGMEAAKGHTASMAGDYSVFEHLLEMSGAMMAATTEEFCDLMMLATYFAGNKRLNTSGKKPRIAALSNAGFEKCAIADHLFAQTRSFCELADYTGPTRDAIGRIFAEYGIANIIDVHDVLDLSPMMNDEGFEKIVRATLSDKNVDLGIYAFVPETIMLNVCPTGPGHSEDMASEGSFLQRIIKVGREIKKPFVVSVESGRLYDRFKLELIAAGIPCFRSADAAARAVAKLAVAVGAIQDGR